MLARVSLLGRHLSPSTYIANSIRRSSGVAGVQRMTSTAEERAARRCVKLFARKTPTQLGRISTAACLIIGDEVLGGKTKDSIDLKRVEVIPDDEADIEEAARRMSAKYDFVVTSGGIGPTHDDITYQSIAKAFGLELSLHQETMKRMKDLSRPHPSQPNFSWDEPSPALEAKMRMARLPIDKSRDESTQVLFVHDHLWVPISVVNGNVHILPGVPRLFEQLIEGMKPVLLPRLVDPEGKGIHRILFSTPLAESEIATYLTQLAQKVEPKGVKVGSYPRWGKKRNTVTLVGRDKEYLDSLESEVSEGVQGYRVQSSDAED